MGGKTSWSEPVIACPASRIISAAAAIPAPAMPVKWMRIGPLLNTLGEVDRPIRGVRPAPRDNGTLDRAVRSLAVVLREGWRWARAINPPLTTAAEFDVVFF